MTVQTYTPDNSQPVEFTDSAILHLAKQVELKHAKGIEFKVKESGCSGFKYLLELTDDIDCDDQVYPLSDSLNCYISNKVIPLIKGTIVDYTKQGVNYNLVFNNPNATALCGCGESFSVTQQDD
jgi:iron-sulfur cluster assembly accessory protein